MDSDPFPERLSGLLFLYNPNPAYFGADSWIAVSIIVVFLIISALMSSSETAFFSINHDDLENLHKENVVSKNRILKLLDKPHYLMSTILISNSDQQD